MKSVLVIAYNFPPDGSAGVYRTLRFVKQLPPHGWLPTVITLESERYDRHDPALLDAIPKEVKVIRVRNKDPWQALQARRAQTMEKCIARSNGETAARIRSAHNMPMRSLLRQLVRTGEAWGYHPDLAMGWIRPAIKAALDICARRSPDVIYATAGPMSSFVVADRLSQKTGIPYVLDFRDSWTIAFNEFEMRRPSWAISRDRRTVDSAMRGAQAVVFRYDSEAECYWRAYPKALTASKIHIIPNGYDGEIEQFSAADGDKCTILYTGTLSPYRYDTLVEALQQFKKSDPARASQLRFIFVGEGTENLAAAAAGRGLCDMIETGGPVAYSKTIQLQQQAHALLLIAVKPYKGFELGGSKVFSYLRAGRPIFGVLAKDEVRKVLQKVGVSTVANIDSPCEIVSTLRTLLEAWSAGRLNSLLPDRRACEAYSAERQTAALVRAFEAKRAAHVFTPGSAEVPSSLVSEIRKAGMDAMTA
jgi:glycosyltransferase involved in cell wall biosynthesis